MASRIALTLVCLPLFGAFACGGESSSDGSGATTGSGGTTSSTGGGASSTGGSSSGTGGTTSSGGTGTGGTYVPGPGECTSDVPCENGGHCTRSNCGAVWTCTEPQACTTDIAEYCGCDGSTFTDSGSCPTRPYSHKGACANDQGPFDCNPAHITCMPILPPEPCEDGKVFSVQGDCHGACVPLSECACQSPSDCPGDNACYNNTNTCGPWLH